MPPAPPRAAAAGRPHAGPAATAIAGLGIPPPVASAHLGGKWLDRPGAPAVRARRLPESAGKPAVLAGMPLVALESGRLERGCEANPERQCSEEHDRGSRPREEAELLESAINAGELGFFRADSGSRHPPLRPPSPAG